MKSVLSLVLLGASAVSAQSSSAARTDEASEATITDATAECTYYSYDPVTTVLADNYYPDIWSIANLSSATSDVIALFDSLNASIPAIDPRGTSAGDFTSVSYNSSDPYCWWTWEQCTTPKIDGLQDDIVRVSAPNSWGYTLDDGPNCSHNVFYDYLKSIDQKATLFYIGSNVLDWPLEAQRGLDDGHEICAHTWSHRYMTALTNEEVFAELYYSKMAIKQVLGVTVQCWRPPYGDIDDRVRYIAQALGLATVIWSDNTFDYTIEDTNKSYIDTQYNDIIQNNANGYYNSWGNGTIVLSHELENFTMSESEAYLPAIRGNFSYVAPIAVFRNNTEPYVESGYTYPNFVEWASGTVSVSLATATAASTVVSVSMPLSSGVTTSVFAALPYASEYTASGTVSSDATLAVSSSTATSKASKTSKTASTSGETASSTSDSASSTSTSTATSGASAAAPALALLVAGVAASVFLA